MLCSLKILATLFLFPLSLSLSAAGSPYFTQLLSRINGYIDEEAYEQVVEALPRFTQDDEFKNLDCYQKGQIFHKVGVAYYLLNREEEAIRCYRDSVLAIWKECPGVPETERANTIYNIGISYQYLGNFQQAKRHLDEALFIFENASEYPLFDLAKKYQGIANFYLDNFDFFRAGLYYENALNIFRDIDGTELRRFDILNNFLILSIDLRQYDKAESYFEEAMELYKRFPESISNYELSILFQNAGIYHFEQGELAEAMARTRSGLNLIDPSTDPDLYSNAIEKIAVINERVGKYSQAIEGMNEVVRIRKQHLSNAQSCRHLAYAYENLFEIYRNQGDIAQAEVFLKKAFETLLIYGDRDNEGVPVVSRSLAVNDLDLVRLLSLRAQLYGSEYDNTKNSAILEKCLSIYAKIDTVISRHLLFFQFQKSKLNFLELIQGYYGDAIRNAVKFYELTGDQKYLELAYFFSSKTKAIILNNELNEAEAFQSVASQEMIDEEKEMVQRMYDIQEQLSDRGANRDSLLRAYTETQRELDNFLLRIERQEPEYFDKKYTFLTPPDIEAVQTRLPDNLAVIEYFYRKDTIYSFWITRDHFSLIPVRNDEELDQAIRSFVDQCRDPNRALSGTTSRFLYEKLMSQGLERVKQPVHRLCIIPDGILHTIPFETINSGEEDYKFLIEDYSVAYSYSVGLLFREKDISFDIPYLGFGARYSPDLSSKLKGRRRLFGEENLAQLALAREEIDRGNTIFSGKSFLDQEATLDNFYKYSANARIIHLSLHGLVDFDDPLRSSILFDDHQEAFVLSASDLYSHKINADLVVLSACHSADGKIYLGEGVQGMSKAFMLSGAQTVLSSLWSASESVALEITTHFLRNVHEGMPNDLALHQAKLEFLTNARPSQQHPFYWANFVLIGTLETGHPKSLFSGKFVFPILVFFALFFFFSAVKFSSFLHFK